MRPAAPDPGSHAGARHGTVLLDPLAWLGAALVLVLAPHVPRLPPWTTLLVALLAAWRLLAETAGWPLPDRRHRMLLFVKRALALGVFVAVAASYGGQLGRDAGVALLVVLVGLKLVEARGERDLYVLALLGYFLVITNFLYSQSMATGVYMLAAVLIVTTALVVLNDHRAALPVRGQLALAGVLLVQAAPLAAAMFVLFPRLPGPLWGMPQEAADAITGLDEEMTLGRISRLGLSDAIAFRVEFEGEVPPAATRYWRGPVLWHTDGRTWTPGRPGREPEPVPVIVYGAPVRYAVTLESHHRRWLYALEMPTHKPGWARQTRDLRLLARRQLSRRVRYELTSYTEYRIAEASDAELERALALPPGRHPRAVALGRRWRAELDDARAVVERALAWFAEQPFYYTLQPPPAAGDPIDEFLFETRRGFCEHYAAAFTVVLRAAGVPARVVTGYQGGEYNPMGDYLIVRQRDAHAWSEVWLAARGWVRVDPTAAVSPARVARGIDEVLPAARARLPLGLEGSDTVQRLWRGMRNAWDAANNAWNQWVLGYTAERQARLLERLGMEHPDWARLGMWLTAALGALLGVLGAIVLRTRDTTGDPARALYERWCRRLARAGIGQCPAEAPLALAARVRRQRPELAEAAARITDLYLHARYGRDPDYLPALERAVRGFHLRRRRSR